MTKIDFSQELEQITAVVAAALGIAECAGLHSPADNEWGSLVLDNEEFSADTNEDDVVIVQSRTGLSNEEWAAALVKEFAEKVGV